MCEGVYTPLAELKTPDEFGFPFTPYAIQQQLMEALFNVLEKRNVGIFESPTGTGKSLTLICSALRWLEMHEKLECEELKERILAIQRELCKLDGANAATTDWLNQQSSARVQRNELNELERLQRLLDDREERLKELRKCKRSNQKSHTKCFQQKDFNSNNNPNNVTAENEHILEDIDMDELNHQSKNDIICMERYRSVQIFFSSRTHSQLAQVMREVKRTEYGQRVRCISLASRQQLCINPHVRRLPTVAAINEQCLEMSQSKKIQNACKSTVTDSECCSKTKKTKDSGCPFKASLQELTTNALTNILDIEELVAEGESIGECPYYAIRQAVPLAQLVMLPYQLLLCHRTRQQSGIDLRGAIVIIDEAHNLLDTIAQLHGVELTLMQLRLLHEQLNAYKSQYKSRFGYANLLRINQLLFVLKRLNGLVKKSNGKRTRMLRTYELTAEAEFFNIDLHQLLEFCEASRLAQKLQSYIKRMQCEPHRNENVPPSTKANESTQSSVTMEMLKRLQQQHHDNTTKKKSNRSKNEHTIEKDVIGKEVTIPHQDRCYIREFLNFIGSLTENAEDGRVMLTIAEENTESSEKSAGYKYLLLNPGAHFADILSEARAVIIAGGTMQPVEELMQQLFSTCPERVRQYFYDHVVPADSVLPLIVSRGPTGKQLCFNYAQRNDQKMLTELGICLLNVCSVVPAGVVCFVPSYEYLDVLYRHLNESNIIQCIAAKKRIFCEKRQGTESVEQLLSNYATAIRCGKEKGALLLSVVGGKMSEGLNFADDLGRAVVLVGLPYPNRHSVELMERMRYLDTTIGTGAGNEYYENLCMKAINQCIGRSVRHIQDYACVCLLDERYAGERVRQKLPQWIAKNLQQPVNFGLMQASIARFFKNQKSKDQDGLAKI